MTPRLTPCSLCSRHIRINEVACPFCGAHPPPESDLPRVISPPEGRLSRAALFAFGAVTVGVVTAMGCGDDAAYGGPPADSGGFTAPATEADNTDSDDSDDSAVEDPPPVDGG